MTTILAPAHADNLLSAMAATGHRIDRAAVIAVHTEGPMREGRIREIRCAYERMTELLEQYDCLPAENLGDGLALRVVDRVMG